VIGSIVGGQEGTLAAIREKLSSLGVLLVLVGLVSSVLQLVGYELRILGPLNDAGPAVAWGTRLGLIVLGGVLFFLAPKSQESPEQS
jgi:hypothetical protein